MKSKNLVIILIVLLVVLSFAYFFASLDKKDRDTETEGFSDNVEIILRAGEERKSGDLAIKMIGISEDSRCLVDIRCIWAGKASAGVELKLGEIIVVATLDTGSNPYVFENYLIKLVNVKPEKVQDREIVQAEYMATFSIETRDSNGIEKIEENGMSENSGIKGYVTIGPICPVLRMGDDKCNDKPVPIKVNIIIKDKEENVIKNVKTMEDGSFSASLFPGNYVIYIDSGGIRGSKPEYVTVEDGKFAEVTIRIDTGIR